MPVCTTCGTRYLRKRCHTCTLAESKVKIRNRQRRRLERRKTAEDKRCQACQGPIDVRQHGASVYCQTCRERGEEVRRALRPTADVRSRLAVNQGWNCWLCEQQIDPAVRWPDPGSASSDHVIPVCMPGSSGVLDNLRLAHLECNVRRAMAERMSEGGTSSRPL